MAVELVTGYSGTEHVSSSDDGARQAGTVGTGMYVLETVDDPLAATLENANTVTVGPGDVLINGRHVRLTGSTTYAVPVGTQAMQTSNLLVLRYSVGDDGTEKVEAVTLTGEPAASDPQDPALATGSILDGDSPVDMELYRVVTTGIESAQPVRLFSTVPTISGLPGVGDNILDVAHGGTGMTSDPSLLVNLGSTSPASAFQESPRPGVTGTLPVSQGGTGAGSAAAAAKTLAFVRLAGQYSDARLEQRADLQQGIKLIADGAMRRMLVGADSYMGMWNIDTSSWLWQLFPDAAVNGVFRSGRGIIHDLSRNTLYGLAPGTYLVANNATNGPESGNYGNLLVSYNSGNRIVGLLAYDNGHVYTTYGASTSATFGWKRVDAIGSGYDTLWTGSVGSGGTISLSLAVLQQYRVVGVMTSYSNTFAIPALVYNNGSGVRVYGVGGFCSDSGDLLLQYFALRQSGSSLVAYVRSQEVYGNSVGGRQNINITGILGVA